MNNPDNSPALTTRFLKQKALWLLGQRDHAAQELRDKLCHSAERRAQRENSPQLQVSSAQLDEVLQWCTEQGFLDDSRFAGHYLVQRSRRGYGPQRVRRELQQKGISRELISQTLVETDVDWEACALEAATKKYAGRWPPDDQEKIKVQGYLYRRGFSSEQIRAVFENFPP